MSRPNIIFVLSDEHRWDCLGYAGNPDVRTPNFDALAANGVSFSQAICPFPLCVPSRTSLMTGQYVGTHGVDDNREGLPADAVTLPGVLHAAGYNTACVGKMHFNPTRTNYGFDTMRLAEQDGPGRYEDDYHAWLEKHGAIDQIELWDQVDRDSAPQEYWDTFGAMRSNLPESQHSTTWIGDQAVRFLQRAREPFFLWTGFVKPHHPFDPPAPWDTLYDPAALTLPEGWCERPPDEDTRHGGHFEPTQMTEGRFRKILAYYYATISHMDKQMGRLFATLASRGFTNNIIVYCSDHGDYMGQHGLITKDSARPYESILRVPLVVAGVVGQRRGAVDSALANLVDAMPTLLDAVGIDIPNSVEGKSLMPQLMRPGIPLRMTAFAEGGKGVSVARNRRHKLVESDDERFKALYDLDADLGEFVNLYRSQKSAAIKAGLKGKLASFTKRRKPVTQARSR